MIDSVFENDFAYVFMLGLIPLLALAMIKWCPVVSTWFVELLFKRRQRTNA